MKHWLRIVFLFVLPLLLGSCEKVINLKLKDVESKYVIEGTITNEAGQCKVLISSTKDFSDANDFKGISGASVTIESKGTAIMLSETSPGVYQNKTAKGTPDQTYELTVFVGGQTFTASCTMPAAAPFREMYIANGDFDATRTVVSVIYKHPVNTENYYWFQQYVNNVERKEYTVFTDEFTVGQEIIAPLVFENTSGDAAKDLKKGDQLVVEMHTVDASVYTYLLSLSGADGSNNEISPANPPTNLAGGALGYFSAHTTQRKILTIP